ncbi:precorrin-6x reductase [Leptotrichia shahii]|jgi:putative precorrin-6A reductase|uniref:Precorrin-6x reductase n=1 Tax=Leptotrichia shahii TaxID=157691 RepID=A0A510JQE7_9FUSO|nr:precorrin-6A/cobalt-precorrin-6A reductase [Leptotrichia shahii]BBM41572.1 precorrin-6x reductase [Leptotrichia shahii]
MIWIIGGTKDSRIILDEVMKVREDDIIVSTATEYGGKLLEGVAKNKNIQIISEKLNILQIENMILEKNID